MNQAITHHTQSTTYLEPKPRYEILDGLRGVAAMLVVAFHLFESGFHNPSTQWLNHGYLAVDFFFALSGFVVGYAYDDRWGRMSLTAFFKRRIVRLHPMVLFGCVWGACLFYWGIGPAFPAITGTPWWQLVLLMLLGCTMLPALLRWDIRGWAETYPLNGPQWSLMFEYIANILYALVFRFLPKAVLAILVALLAVNTLSLALDWDWTGLLAGRGANAYTVIGGWNVTPTELYVGFTRLLYPFLAGLLLSRLKWLLRLRAGFWWCALALFVLFAVPRPGGGEAGLANGLYEAFVIIVMLPLIVSAGAGSPITGRRSVAVCKFLGDISYPLYITHFPIVYLQFAFVANHPDAPREQVIASGIGAYLAAIFVAYAAMRLYDIPVRKWLRTKWL